MVVLPAVPLDDGGAVSQLAVLGEVGEVLHDARETDTEGVEAGGDEGLPGHPLQSPHALRPAGQVGVTESEDVEDCLAGGVETSSVVLEVVAVAPHLPRPQVVQRPARESLQEADHHTGCDALGAFKSNKFVWN